jgi:hypothetical protein
VDAVRSVDLQARGAVGVAGDLVDVGGTEPRARVSVLGPADRRAHLGMHEQMHRLIFFVCGAGMVHIGQLVERELTIDGGGVARPLDVDLLTVVVVQLAHPVVTRVAVQILDHLPRVSSVSPENSRPANSP